MMDSIKQDLKVVEEEEDQYEKDMKLQVEKRVKQCLILTLSFSLVSLN